MAGVGRLIPPLRALTENFPVPVGGEGFYLHGITTDGDYMPRPSLTERAGLQRTLSSTGLEMSPRFWALFTTAQENGFPVRATQWARCAAKVTVGSAPSRDNPPVVSVCCKALRSGARDRTPNRPSRGEHDSRAPVPRRLPAVPCGHGDSHAARPCRRRNAAARSRPQCRQRHRCALLSMRKLSCVSGCPLPQWLGISSRRILRRSILGK